MEMFESAKRKKVLRWSYLKRNRKGIYVRYLYFENNKSCSVNTNLDDVWGKHGQSIRNELLA